jgi:enamine deaminase RidA (YjgF/YER057c/UK114 family)
LNKNEVDAGLPQTANYRYANRVGAQLFVAGQLPYDSNSELVGEDDPYRQASQCLNNLQTLITLHRFDVRDIRKLTIYVVGKQENLGKAWEAVTTWFENDVPPATLLGVAALGYQKQLVEIDAQILAEE